MTIQALTREQVEHIWAIDRRAVIDRVYYFEDGKLALKPEHYELQGWPPGEPEKCTPILRDSHSYRKTGLGRRLFEQAVEKARAMPALKLYISATPSENTVNFYLHLGCVIAEETDYELFALEPEAIHLEVDLRETTSDGKQVDD